MSSNCKELLKPKLSQHPSHLLFSVVVAVVVVVVVAVAVAAAVAAGALVVAAAASGVVVVVVVVVGFVALQAVHWDSLPRFVFVSCSLLCSGVAVGRRPPSAAAALEDSRSGGSSCRSAHCAESLATPTF